MVKLDKTAKNVFHAKNCRNKNCNAKTQNYTLHELYPTYKLHEQIYSFQYLAVDIVARIETPWHSIHGHGWSRPGHQWIQFVGGHYKFHRWPWMVHGWSTTGHRWSFEKFFEQKFVRSAKVRNVR